MKFLILLKQKFVLTFQLCPKCEMCNAMLTRENWLSGKFCESCWREQTITLLNRGVK